jgi:hypothetical protein
MGHTASRNENSKANEHPTEGNIAPFPHEVDQCYRNTEIRKSDEAVGERMEPNQRGLPLIAESVWHESI